MRLVWSLLILGASISEIPIQGASISAGDWDDGGWGETSLDRDETDHTEVEDTTGEVTCPELKWPAFSPFKTNPVNTKCWEEVKPSFRLYLSQGNGTLIQDTNSEGLTLQNHTEVSIKHLVVIIHGFIGHAEVGESYWAHQMSNLILEEDTVHQPGLAVLTVDWKYGAAFVGSYEVAAANSRYVGVATQRVVRQLLHQEEEQEDVYIHCIGYSLGAHACGFFGNAVTNDTDYLKASIDRITALDPAGPLFTKENFGIFNFISDSPGPLGAESLRDYERLDKTDAVKVDVIHSDSDGFGTVQSVGQADFYVGDSLENLGTSQAGCWNMNTVCDHSRVKELMRFSVRKQNQCWANLTCGGQTGTRGCSSPADLRPGLHFGYWWDGREGNYGVVLQGEQC